MKEKYLKITFGTIGLIIIGIIVFMYYYTILIAGLIALLAFLHFKDLPK